MRKIALHIIPALLCIFLLNACKKSFSDQQSIPMPPEQPNLTATIRMSVTGMITNENGDPAVYATVNAGSKSTFTDAYGYFKINDVVLSKEAGFIKISKTGYFDTYKTFVGIENKETFIRSKLIPKVETGTINASSGGTVNTTDGGTVTLPANAVVNAGTNAAYSGTVHVAAHVFNQNDMNEWNETTPGDQRGTDIDGNLQFLRSYGMMAVELTGDAGELLQIATGKTALITTPIPSAIATAAPATIPLWSFNTAKGLWKQEATATKNGNSYTGNVPHFSFWDGAIGLPLVNLTVQVVNTALQPLANVCVRIRRASEPFYTGFASWGYTNAQGIVSGAVFANENLILDVMTPCAIAAYSHPFTTTNTDIDLGTVTGNLGQNMVTVSGTVKNCSGNPVTNGYVILFNGWSQVIPIINGSFSHTGLNCGNMSTEYICIDNDTHQQSTSQPITLVPGVNDLGNLSACGISTVSYIKYWIDGVLKTIIEPTDTLMAIGPAQANTEWTILLWVQYANPGSSGFNCQISGGTSVGNNHYVTDIWADQLSTGRCIANPGLQVTYTEYGSTGEFITGSFEGTVLDFILPSGPGGSPHNFKCEFRMRKNN